MTDISEASARLGVENRVNFETIARSPAESVEKSPSDQIADEASAIIKRAANLVMQQIDSIQKKLDAYREQLIAATLEAENSIQHTMLAIGQIGVSAAEFDKQVDELIKSSEG